MIDTLLLLAFNVTVIACGVASWTPQDTADLRRDLRTLAVRRKATHK